MMKIEICRWYQWRYQVYNSKDKIKHIHQNQNVRCAYHMNTWGAHYIKEVWNTYIVILIMIKLQWSLKHIINFQKSCYESSWQMYMGIYKSSSWRCEGFTKLCSMNSTKCPLHLCIHFKSKKYYVIVPWRQNHKILAPPQHTCIQNFQAYNFVIKDASTYSLRWLNGENKGLRKNLAKGNKYQ
jgi:hypothetical protein